VVEKNAIYLPGNLNRLNKPLYNSEALLGVVRVIPAPSTIQMGQVCRSQEEADKMTI